MNATIPNVAICSLGEAKGHGLKVDRYLLEQLAKEIGRKGRVPVKLNHRGGLDTVVGFIEKARLCGTKLLGSLTLLKSSHLFDFTRELIAQFGNTIGLSPAFTGDSENLRDGTKAARCSELLSVDLVEHPASNASGLFSARISGTRYYFSAKPPPTPDLQEIRDLQRRLERLQRHFSARPRNDREGSTPFHDVVTGAVEGGLGVLATEPLIKAVANRGGRSVGQILAASGREIVNGLRNPRQLLPKFAVGAAVGAVATGAVGAAVNVAHDFLRNKPRGSHQRQFSRVLTPDEQRERSLVRVSAYKNQVCNDELDRGIGSYRKTAIAGAVSGALVGGLKGKAKLGAGLGALAGVGSLAAIRAAMPPDQYGQRSPEEHHVESLPTLAATAVGAEALRRRLSLAKAKASSFFKP